MRLSLPLKSEPQEDLSTEVFSRREKKAWNSICLDQGDGGTRKVRYKVGKKIKAKEKKPPPALSCDCHQHTQARLFICRDDLCMEEIPGGSIGSFIAFRWGQYKMG